MNSPAAPCTTEMCTGMAHSVLAEVASLLAALAERGETGSVDLRSLPMTDADRNELEELLGRGEVSAELEVAGHSEIWETAYPGAWWVRHRGAGDRISSEEIAVCPVPEILAAHPADISAAAERIRQDLKENKPSKAEAKHG
jgi:hydrogenase-1 operon protein HyaF